MLKHKILSTALVSLLALSATGCAAYKAMWLKHPVDQSALLAEFEAERQRFCSLPENSSDIKCNNPSDQEKYQGLSIKFRGLIVSDYIPYDSMRIHDEDGNDMGVYTVIGRDTNYYNSANYHDLEMSNRNSPTRKDEIERMNTIAKQAKENYEYGQNETLKKQYEEMKKAEAEMKARQGK